jgi:hypothetical protein
MELTQRQHDTIEASRKAMIETIKAAYPEDLQPLLVVGIVAAFLDVCRSSLAIINSELSAVGLQVVKRERH